MNWVGGARQRVKFKKERKLQKEFFERKKLCVKASAKPQYSQTPIQKSNPSQDLLALHTISKTFSGSKGDKSSLKPIKKVDFDHMIKPKMKFINEVELPSSPGETPSRLLVMGSAHKDNEKKFRNLEKLKTFETWKQNKPKELNRNHRSSKDFDDPFLFITPNISQEKDICKERKKYQGQKELNNDICTSSSSYKEDGKKISWNLREEKAPNILLSPLEFRYESNHLIPTTPTNTDESAVKHNSFPKEKNNFRNCNRERYDVNVFATEDFQMTPLLRYETHDSEPQKLGNTKCSMGQNVTNYQSDCHSPYNTDNLFLKCELEKPVLENDCVCPAFSCTDLVNSYDQCKKFFLPDKDFSEVEDFSIWDRLYKKKNTQFSFGTDKLSAKSTIPLEENKPPNSAAESEIVDRKDPQSEKGESHYYDNQIRDIDTSMLCKQLKTPDESSDNTEIPNKVSFQHYQSETSKNVHELVSTKHTSSEGNSDKDIHPDDSDKISSSSSSLRSDCRNEFGAPLNKHRFCNPPFLSSQESLEGNNRNKSYLPESSVKEFETSHKNLGEKNWDNESSLSNGNKHEPVSPVKRFKLCKEEHVEDVLEEMLQLEDQDNSEFSQELFLEDSINAELQLHNSSKGQCYQVVPEDFSDHLNTQMNEMDSSSTNSVLVPENDSSKEPNKNLESDDDVLMTMNFIIQSVILCQETVSKTDLYSSQLFSEACSQLTCDISPKSESVQFIKKEAIDKFQCQECSKQEKSLKHVHCQTDTTVVCDRSLSPLHGTCRDFGTQFPLPPNTSGEVYPHELSDSVSQINYTSSNSHVVETIKIPDGITYVRKVTGVLDTAGN